MRRALLSGQSLKYLSDYFNEDRSSFFKKSLYEMYEDIQDLKFVDKYIKDSSKGERRFISADNLFPENEDRL